jgi:hypothetical protein
MESGTLADQEPYTAWLRRGTGRDRVTVENKLYEPLGTAEAIQIQSRQRFGRPGGRSTSSSAPAKCAAAGTATTC